jgi:signal transduction histidine kinase
MLKPPVPLDESSRLQALFDYHVMDSEQETAFDELTELVSRILDVPIALVSLVDETRQWFKSRHGLDVSETPREYAFCAHAILDEEVLVVEDSHNDSRFSDNPLVIDQPHVRFYAGAPLITPNGHKIGTICGIDHEPKHISEDQRRILEIIAKQVISQLELRKNIAAKDKLFLDQNQVLEQLESAHQEIQDLVSVISHDLRAPVLNLVGFSDELETGTNDVAQLLTQAEEKIPADVKERVMNIITDDLNDSVIHMQRSAKQLRERVDAITALSKHRRRELSHEDTDLNELIDDIVDCHSMTLKQIKGNVEKGNLTSVKTDKVALQIIIENLVANAVKYRDENRQLQISIDAVNDGHSTVFQVTDNGRGISEHDLNRIFLMFSRVGEQNTEGDGTGLAFCRAIVGRLGGKIWCESTLGSGTTFHVCLPHEQGSTQDIQERVVAQLR